MGALFENKAKMSNLFDVVESCGAGQSLNGCDVSNDLSLLLPTVDALFEVFERKGYGVRSQAIGESLYIGYV